MDAIVPLATPLAVVVVGVTDSAASRRALEWAGAVVAEGGTLHLVGAIRPTVELAVAAMQVDSKALVAERRHLVDTAEHQLGEVIGDRSIRIETHVIEDIPADAIVGVADQVGAELVVLGAHEQVFRHPKLLGRTINGVLHTSRVPVAIVGERHRRGGFDTGSIVVGVGTGPATQAALAWSAGLAERSHLGLTLVRAVQRQPVFTPEGVLSLIAYYLDPTVINRWAHEDLAEFAAEIQAATDGELDISLSAPLGRVGAHLVEASADASVLVVGRPTRPAGMDQVTPGWMHHAIAHAPCPVVVVPVGDG